MEQPISLGVVGCGYWGPNLVRNFKGLAECRMRAMCDRSEARLKHMRSVYSDVEGHDRLQPSAQRGRIGRRRHCHAGASIIIRWPRPACSPASTRSSRSRWPRLPAECEELIEIAERKGLVLMVGHTFLYSSPVRKICRNCSGRRHWRDPLHQLPAASTWDCSKRTSTWPGTWRRTTSRSSCISLENFPLTVNCQGNAHVTPGIEDVTNMSLSFSPQALCHHSEQLARAAERFAK